MAVAANSAPGGRESPVCGRVTSAFVAMETLRRPRHIRVGGQFYVAQFFDPETKDVLAGPVPEVPLDPAATVLGRTASSAGLRRLTREQYELAPGDQEYPWPTISRASGDEGQPG